jgi:lipoprotein-anchoring transpeptidase ErfK/SrfK
MTTGYKYSYRGKSPAPKHGGGGSGNRNIIIALAVGVILVIVFFVWRGMKSGAPAETTGVPENTATTTAESTETASAGTAGTSETTPSAPVRPEVKVPEISDAAKASLDKLCETAEALLKKEEYRKASEIARKVTDKAPEDSVLWLRAVKVLNKANTTIITSDIPVPEKKIYNVKSGDNLDRIAKSFNTTIEAMIKINPKLTSTTSMIHPGDQLRMYDANWKIRVSKKHYRLYLYDGDKLFKVYNVGIGKQDRTPVGTFEIVDKIAEPPWKEFPYGAKENVLGTRWMRLKPTGKTDSNLKGYGIHGTWEPNSIGKNSSNGCIRMRNEEVEELFSLIPKYPRKGAYGEVIIKE